MKTWTETPTLAALAVLFTLILAGCAEDGPANMTEAEPETLDTTDSPETFYRSVLAPPGPMHGLGTPRYRIPRYYRFQSELAKRQFLAEVVGPPVPGSIIRFESVDWKHPNLPFIDVRLSPEGRLQTELVNPRNLPRIGWEPGKAQRGPGGAIWTH